MMKQLLITLLAVLTLTACNQQSDTADAIRRMIEQHPQMTMQDVYKSFYQDRFGPGHMIGDTAAFNKYSRYELAVAATDSVPNPYYEPVGAQGRYIRVYLRCVNEGLIPADLLFDAFLRSTVPAQQPKQSWEEEWSDIEQTARELGVTASDEDCEALRQAAKDEQAVHHSDTYRNAYHPHYRIVRRDIFENELKPLIEQ